MCKGKTIVAFLSKHFLPIGTLLIIPLGIILPSPAVYLQSKLPVIKMCIVTLFFVIGMKCRLPEMKSALHSYKEIVLGLIVVLFLTPMVGTKLMMLPKFQEISLLDLRSGNTKFNNSWSIELPYFGPEEFRIGLQIFCVSPCASAFPIVVVSLYVKSNAACISYIIRRFVLSNLILKTILLSFQLTYYVTYN